MGVVDCIIFILILSIVGLVCRKKEKVRTFCEVAILVLAVLGVFASIRFYTAAKKVDAAIERLEQAGAELEEGRR